MEYLLIFLEGIASFISPCLLPMVPIYISYLVGSEKENQSKSLLLINSLGFVLGFTFVFILLSIFASTLGRIISNYIGVLQIIFGIIMVFLGLNFMEVIQVNFLNLSSKMKIKHDKTGFINSLIFGIVFSISWTPCVGAFLASALMTIMTEGEILEGIIMIILYSIGLGIPFILSAVLIDKLQNTFKFIKKHYGIIKNISGIFLIIMGLYTIIK